MVQQLSLGAVVKGNRLETLQRSLDTITGIQGQQFHRQTVILSPRFPYDPPEQAGQINQIESHKMRLTRVWDAEKSAQSLVDISKQDLGNTDIWTLQLSDIPAAGNDKHISIQNIHETTIYQSDDIIGYIEELGYKLETEFWVKGYRWYWGDIIIELSNLLVKDSSSGNDLRPLSSNWMVRTLVNVINNNDLESISKGKRQLEALKKELYDVVRLTVPDRTTMDSRVGSKLGTVNANNISIRK